MKPAIKKKLRLILTVLVLIALLWYSRSGQGAQGGVSLEAQQSDQIAEDTAYFGEQPDEDGEYSSKEQVALYIHFYGHLPKNYVTKAQAREKGWDGGSLEEYFSGYSIGGDKFGNREGLLPASQGRQYYECDIDTAGAAQRGAKRIVYSNDGLVYYTEDHYESFVLLYGEE